MKIKNKIGMFLPERVGNLNSLAIFKRLEQKEKDKLSPFIKQISGLRNMGEYGSIELALKLGAFLTLHDPENTVGQEMANRTPLWRQEPGGEPGGKIYRV